MKRLLVTLGVIAAGVIAGGQTIQPTGGGGGGISSLTANSSPTIGFSGGQLFYSDGSKLQASVVTYSATNLSINIPGALNSTDGTGQFELQYQGTAVMNLLTSETRFTARANLQNNPVIGFQALSAGGSAPSSSGTCAVTSQTGGNTIGSFIASGACAAGTYIFGFAFAATNGWSCDAQDRTTITDTVQQTASTTTNATFKATTASADVVSWKCLAY